MTEQEAQQAQTIEDHAEFVAKFKEFASEPQNELSKQSEEVLQSKLNQAEKSLIDLQAQEIARLESKKTQVFQVCRANIKWQREQRKLQAQKIAEQAKEIERLKIVKTEQQMCDAYDDIYGPVKSVADRKQYMAWMECARFLAVVPK